MPKRQTSLRLSAVTDKQIGDLAAGYKMTRAEVVSLAVDRLYRDIGGQCPDQPAFNRGLEARITNLELLSRQWLDQ